jgi:hypothetical protein
MVFDDGPAFRTYRHEYAHFCAENEFDYLSLTAHEAWGVELKRRGLSPENVNDRLSVAEILINRVMKNRNIDFKGNSFDE